MTDLIITTLYSPAFKTPFADFQSRCLYIIGGGMSFDGEWGWAAPTGMEFVFTDASARELKVGGRVTVTERGDDRLFLPSEQRRERASWMSQQLSEACGTSIRVGIANPRHVHLLPSGSTINDATLSMENAVQLMEASRKPLRR